MTSKARLVPITQILPYIELFRQNGLDINYLDVRGDGLTIASAAPYAHTINRCNPVSQSTNEVSAYDAWKRTKTQNADNARPAHSS